MITYSNAESSDIEVGKTVNLFQFDGQIAKLFTTVIRPILAALHLKKEQKRKKWVKRKLPSNDFLLSILVPTSLSFCRYVLCDIFIPENKIGETFTMKAFPDGRLNFWFLIMMKKK